MTKPHSTSCPAVPPHRKTFGTSVNIDGDMLLYTTAEMEAYGQACFKAGRQPPVTTSTANTTSMADAIQNDEDRWSNYRSGRGSRPGTR